MDKTDYKVRIVDAIMLYRTYAKASMATGKEMKTRGNTPGYSFAFPCPKLQESRKLVLEAEV